MDQVTEKDFLNIHLLFRFTPSNYPAEVEAKIQKYRKQGYKLPPRKVLRTPEQLEGIRESAKINTALLDYISENIREGMSTEEIDVLVYDFTTNRIAINQKYRSASQAKM